MNKIRLKDVPEFPAYLVFHDAYDNGAMDVFPFVSIEIASKLAQSKNTLLENQGYEEAGIWKAYTKLPRVRIFKLHTLEQSHSLEKWS